MFGEQKAAIPSMLLGSCSQSCWDLFNSSMCVVAACGLGKSKRIITGQEGQLCLVLIKLMT